MLTVLWLGACHTTESLPPCDGGILAAGVYDAENDACLVGALGDCREALGTWDGDGCPTLEAYTVARFAVDEPRVEGASCGCVDGTGAAYTVINGASTFSGDTGRMDRLVFDATGTLRWVLTVSGNDRPLVCCKPEGHGALWMSYGTPVPGLDCSVAIEDTSVGPDDAICDGL